jgi:transcriptional regulator with XRE-family HTH domain
MKNFVTSTPNSYPRLVELDMDKLNEAIESKRLQLKISSREVCRLVGEHTPSSFTRLRSGKHPSVSLFIRILIWLNKPDINDFIRDIE